MNEEQLKEIAILAKELGFKTNTFSTKRVFVEFIDGEKTAGAFHMSHYLLLCEIQLWLLEEKEILVELNSTFSKMYGYIVYKNSSPYPSVNEQDFKNYKDALATGILESLKLIKNENN